MKTLFQKIHHAAVLLLGLLLLSLPGMAQRGDLSKLSPLVRQALLSQQMDGGQHRAAASSERTLTAFVKTCDGDTDRLVSEGCRVLRSFGNIHIVSIPLARLGALSLSRDVLRIEAGESCTVTMDSTALHVGALPVYAGEGLPQAYTGRGVVMGIMDIGFDLTHPTFYSKDLTDYRIRALWDQLSTDTVGSALCVGRDYVGTDALLSLGCSRDGHGQTHGTHTAGIAAGSGHDSNYRGMAYDSDLCLVANYTSNNHNLVDSVDRYKYTTATDALGFLYIFDYAARQGKPCVISFSEGYHPDLYGTDQLFYAVLDSLTGPGRILCASAGNESLQKGYFRKPAGTESMGAFVYGTSNSVAWLMRSHEDFSVRLVFYGEQNDTLTIPSGSVFEAADSIRRDTLWLLSGEYQVLVAGYPSCYDATERAYEMYVTAPQQLGRRVPVSVELLGREADVEWFRASAYLQQLDLNPRLTAGEASHNILAPAAAPAVIAVGANSYRTGVTNWQGEWQPYDQGTEGVRGDYSSVGPTLDGLTKPDVLAPGTNVVSSYSSYYLEQNPTAGDLKCDVAHFAFGGRTYAWTANSGTSMSSPVVGGAIALWLQANPYLSPADCKRILAKTCRQPDATLSYPNNYYGHGEIDVYAGLLEALNLLDAIPELSTRQPSAVRCALCGDQLRLTAANEKPLAVRIYTTSGQLLMVRQLSGSTEYTISLEGMPRGVLAVQLNGQSAAETGSTLIRHD